MLQGTREPLASRYDLAMLDLDGVVYVGGDAVAGAPAHLAVCRRWGLRCAFITNSAARTPDEIAIHLAELGVPASASDVVTSAQAAARVLLDRYGAGAPVAVSGADGLRQACARAGLVVVEVASEDARAVVTGYGPDVPWRDIMRVAARVRAGLPWVATNPDGSIPTPFGMAPGHGVLVEMIRRFAGVEPLVAGKPAGLLFEETVRRVGGGKPLMIGDRLDTDIAGARRAGVDSMLVLTGVTGLDELVAAPRSERPTYLAGDLSGLLVPHPRTERRAPGWHCGGWTAEVEGGQLAVTGSGARDDWWRAVAVAAWEAHDATRRVPLTTDLVPPDSLPSCD